MKNIYYELFYKKKIEETKKEYINEGDVTSLAQGVRRKSSQETHSQL